jgi:16S rRNA (guanine527-N7)-methyltransferase
VKTFHVKQTPFTADDFQTATGVSRETLTRCKTFVDLLVDWNTRMNLIARSTVAHVWHRHMLDSAQIKDHLPAGTETLVDLGSGAGFPGLVLAILGVPNVHLVESTGKKAAFLRAAADATGVSVTIHNDRIEAIKPFEADVVTARALAPLDKLIAYGHRFAGPRTCHIYLKGQHVVDELTDAHKIWKMQVDRKPSTTDPRGSVLCVSEVSNDQSDQFLSPSSPVA